MIGIIGLDYKTASIKERELFVISKNQQVNLSKILLAKTGLTGIVILFTCNRTEIYFSTAHNAMAGEIKDLLISLLEKHLGITRNVSRNFYFKTGDDAIKHLFGVVSGYESMIFGEAQIAAQVKEAYFLSDRLKTTDSVLKRLFEKAFETGKKVRTETKLNEGAFSVSYAGIEKCRSIYPDFQKKKIFIIGTGKTGELTLMTLLKKGCSDIKITNRSPEKAMDLGRKFKVDVLPYKDMTKGLYDADIVFVATAGQSYILTRDIIESVMAQRERKPLVIVDYSVPRNVDPEINSLKDVSLYDVDYLENVLEENTLKRKKMMRRGLKIIEQSTTEYTDWLHSRKLKPVIASLNDHFSKISEKELEGFMKVYKAENDELLGEYNRHITGKYIRLLIRNMKEVTENGKKAEYIDILEKLFEIY
ncbi:MAG: glutamyl-tRNA reductase [Bacteroidales bacterium]|nr:glutamyl-tRNA reductase [Bacteroidales bacterium]